MMWEDARHIYDYWKKDQDYYMVKYAGDDRFLYHENFTFEHWPRGEIYSFKFDGAKYQPDATIALLNGQSDFPNLVEEYYDELRMYKMGRKVHQARGGRGCDSQTGQKETHSCQKEKDGGHKRNQRNQRNRGCQCG